MNVRVPQNSLDVHVIGTEVMQVRCETPAASVVSVPLRK
jgi:hypothetical protein